MADFGDDLFDVFSEESAPKVQRPTHNYRTTTHHTNIVPICSTFRISLVYALQSQSIRKRKPDSEGDNVSAKRVKVWNVVLNMVSCRSAIVVIAHCTQ